MQDRDSNAATNDSTESMAEKQRTEGPNARPARYILTLVPGTEPAETPREVRPEVKDFIKRVIVPILVKKYVAKLKQPCATDRNAKTNEQKVGDSCLTFRELAERWSCSLQTLSTVVHSPKSKLLRFDDNGRIPIAAVERFERKYGTSR
jgi:hypothetical protein